MKTRLFALLIAVAAALSVGTASARTVSPERLTEQRTRDFLKAVERKDLPAVAAMLTPEATLTMPMTFSGNQRPDAVFTGKDEVLAYYQSVLQLMAQIDFVDERITVAAGGRTSFVEANGNFVTADGRPYRNVYLYRFDWRSGHGITRVAEYGNPITFCQTFPASPVC